VTPIYSPESGGVTTCAREVACRLVERGVAVDVLTVDPTGDLPPREILDGAPVRRLRSWPRGADYRFAPALGGHMRRSGCDVVHIQCYQTLVAPFAMLAAARARIPYVLTFHGGGHSLSWRNAIRRQQLQVMRPLLARASRLIATADWEVEYYSTLLELPVERFVVIPNGGDLPAVPEPRTPAVGTLIVSVGRLERYKGHHRVLAALPGVIREVPDARLWIAGEGPHEAELVALAQELGVSDRVEIGPERDRQKYAARLASASLAALLSEFETQPIGALEAITLGVPTLVADNSGLAELAEKDLARAVSLEDGNAMHAAAMVEMIRDPPPRAEVVMPSWDDCVDSLLELYGAVLGHRVRSQRPALARRDA
jgi:glycosyltransferase involved in cell wall biosynthesis